MNAPKKFRLFACCIAVKGACRSLICDLQRDSFAFIPNGLCEILSENQGCSIEDIKKKYNNEYDQTIDEYFDFLLKNEYGFLCDNPAEFPDLKLYWDEPDQITNAIVDVDKTSNHDFADIFSQLDDLGCKALEIRFFDPVSLEALTDIMEAAASGGLRCINLILPYHQDISYEDFSNLCAAYQRIDLITVHGAPRDEYKEEQHFCLYYRTRKISGPECCGEIHPGYFMIHIKCFMESQRYNSCLNRKISLDVQGNIKNCPSMKASFGNIRNTSLHGALAKRDFKKYWEINKDQINICKDCEFRHICTDCRAYITDDQDIYAKPSKCNYNPYKAEWE